MLPVVIIVIKILIGVTMWQNYNKLSLLSLLSQSSSSRLLYYPKTSSNQLMITITHIYQQYITSKSKHNPPTSPLLGPTPKP